MCQSTNEIVKNYNKDKGEMTIEENALIDALRTKKISGAILDVFHNEPLPNRNPYRKLKNVVLTPHIAGNIDLVFPMIALHFAKEVERITNV